eukprot:6784456-Karenia_brevis.AAC.1
MAEQRSILSIPAAPAMPTCVYANIAQAGGDSTPYAHQDNIAPRGYVSSQWFTLVHEPVSLKHARLIPDAMKALDDEWNKLAK